MGLVVEAVRAIGLPCSLPLLVIGALALVASRWSVSSTVMLVTGGAVGAWLVAIGRVPGDIGTRLLPGVLLLAAAVTPIAVRQVARPSLPGTRWTSSTRGVIGVAAGLAAGMLWEPCVGAHLGTILTDASNNGGIATLPRLLVYVTFVLTPLWGVTAWRTARASDGSLRRQVPAAALGGLAFLGVLAVAGWFTDLTGMLYRASSSL